MELTGAIKALRAALALNQREFAAASGLGRFTLAHLEAGDKHPAPGSLVRLAQAARDAHRDDLAEVFVSELPGVRQGLLTPAWSEVIDPKEFPRWLFHLNRPPALVNSPREERALGAEWSRHPLPK
jgi:transcriptional regulator with XRE-family HTH domain